MHRALVLATALPIFDAWVDASECIKDKVSKVTIEMYQSADEMTFGVPK